MLSGRNPVKRNHLKLHIYPTDPRWFEFLSGQPGIDEVNFWRPGGKVRFTQLEPGELLLFRLRGSDRIAGGGFFLHTSLFPLNAAWEAFGIKNGVPNYATFFQRIAEFKGFKPAETMPADVQIGCMILITPFFLSPSEWIDLPRDFPMNAQIGKGYDSETGYGKEVFEQVLNAIPKPASRVREAAIPQQDMFGEPTLIRRRIGQGGFRVLVTDFYDRRCAVTGERTLPVLEAAHILPVTSGGLHSPDNGLLLRSDIHTLFDLGYVTIDKLHRFIVSQKLKDEWSNGRIYYDLHGSEIRVPKNESVRPASSFLEWHNTHRFRS
jgi:putative restriction endonuclease